VVSLTLLNTREQTETNSGMNAADIRIKGKGRKHKFWTNFRKASMLILNLDNPIPTHLCPGASRDNELGVSTRDSDDGTQFSQG